MPALPSTLRPPAKDDVIPKKPICELHCAQAASIPRHVQAQNFARLALGHHIERMAAHLAVRCEPLARHARVHHHFERLPAEWALDFPGNFHRAI